MNTEKFKARVKCMFNGHRMEKYLTKIVNGVYGKAEAQNRRCADCKYVQKYWVVREKFRHPVRHH